MRQTGPASICHGKDPRKSARTALRRIPKQMPKFTLVKLDQWVIWNYKAALGNPAQQVEYFSTFADNGDSYA